MSYFNRLNKFGEMVKVLKLYIVALTVSIVADYLDLPSKVVGKYGIIPFSVVLVCVCTFVIIYILQNHIFNSFKNKNINEIDSLISVFRPLRVSTRNNKPPAMRVGNKGYTKNITNQLQ